MSQDAKHAWMFEALMNAQMRSGTMIELKDNHLHVGTHAFFSSNGLVGCVESLFEYAVEQFLVNGKTISQESDK